MVSAHADADTFQRHYILSGTTSAYVSRTIYRSDVKEILLRF